MRNRYENRDDLLIDLERACGICCLHFFRQLTELSTIGDIEGLECLCHGQHLRRGRLYHASLTVKGSKGAR